MYICMYANNVCTSIFPAFNLVENEAEKFHNQCNKWRYCLCAPLSSILYCLSEVISTCSVALLHIHLYINKICYYILIECLSINGKMNDVL